MFCWCFWVILYALLHDLSNKNRLLQEFFIFRISERFPRRIFKIQTTKPPRTPNQTPTYTALMQPNGWVKNTGFDTLHSRVETSFLDRNLSKFSLRWAKIPLSFAHLQTIDLQTMDFKIAANHGGGHADHKHESMDPNLLEFKRG